MGKHSNHIVKDALREVEFQGKGCSQISKVQGTLMVGHY